MSDSTKGLLLAILSALMWGLLAIALKVALNYTDSFTIVWWRFSASFLVLVLWFLFRSPQSLRILRRPPRLLLLAAVLLGINFIGFQQGIHYAGPAVSQVIIQAGPVNLALVGFIFFHEQISRIRLTGFIVAAFGFFFFYYQQVQGVSYAAREFTFGVIWTLIGALSWTGYAVINKILVRKIPPMQVNLVLYGLPMLFFLPMADLSSLFQAHSLAVWLLFLFLALNTLIAYGGLSMALKYIEANRISMIVTLNPIITFLLLELLLHLNVKWFDSLPMAPLAYVGAVLVLGGAVMAIGFHKKRNQ